jgi:hypothetical protein
MNAYHQKSADLAASYAQNRADMNLLNKQIAVLTDWKRPDKGVDLSEVRTEYLEDGDRWRGWAHAIEVIEDYRDESNPITAEQRVLAAMLDRKASLRVQAGKIKRGIAAVGRQLLRTPA